MLLLLLLQWVLLLLLLPHAHALLEQRAALAVSCYAVVCIPDADPTAATPVGQLL
jgi:hypothetical protein